MGSFSVAQCIRYIKAPSWLGLYSGVRVHKALKRLTWLGFFSVVWCLRSFKGQPLYCLAASAGVWGERNYGDGSTPYAWLSGTALTPWLPCFPPQAVPTTNSSLLAPWAVSLQLTADLALGLLHNHYTPAPSRCAFLGTPISVWGMYGCSKDCLCDSHPS